ncbi:MAG: aspartate kinase [Gemmatimonadales bacterium]|nr:aspartate kinase [Gemmatimonadales bacterium]
MQTAAEVAGGATPAAIPPAATSEGTLVIKFGGTALGTASRIRAAARRVRAAVDEGYQPIVVVSATGHTTDRLLRRVRAAAARGGAAPSLAREADRALATGEDLSAALLATALIALGVRAVSFRGGEAGIVAGGAHGAAQPVHLIPGPLRTRLARGEVPVVSGFQAVREDGEVVTLGRGGSDVSAVFLGAELGAVGCWIVTDVDGVYTADPRRVPGAVRLPVLDHADLLRLTRAGAEVVHPVAAELAARASLPLRVLHHAAPRSHPTGTEVVADTGWAP